LYSKSKHKKFSFFTILHVYLRLLNGKRERIVVIVKNNIKNLTAVCSCSKIGRKRRRS